MWNPLSIGLVILVVVMAVFFGLVIFGQKKTTVKEDVKTLGNTIEVGGQVLVDDLKSVINKSELSFTVGEDGKKVIADLMAWYQKEQDAATAKAKQEADLIAAKTLLVQSGYLVNQVNPTPPAGPYPSTVPVP